MQIFNARPTDKTMKKEGDRVNSSLADGNKLFSLKEDEIDFAIGKKKKKYLLGSEEEDDDPLHDAGDGTTEKESSYKKQKNELLNKNSSNRKENDTSAKKRKKSSKLESNEDDIADNSQFPLVNPEVNKELKHKKQRKKESLMHTATDHEGRGTITTKGDRKLKKKLKQNAGGIIDDGEAPFVELFATEAAENATSQGQIMDPKSVPDADSAGGLVTIPPKSKKNKNQSARSGIIDLSPVHEVGLGGPSTWDD